jgi:hypothetical protein
MLIRWIIIAAIFQVQQKAMDPRQLITIVRLPSALIKEKRGAIQQTAHN